MKNPNELFHPQNRIDAAKARVKSSEILLKERRFSASIYFSGVAVESILRAFIERDSKTFEERHNILKMSEHASIHPFYYGNSKMKDCLDDINLYWDNKYRYTDDVKLMTFYQSRGLIKHSKLRDANILKNLAIKCNEAAASIVKKGMELYKGV